MDNISPAGSLETDKFARAVLQHRNAPDPETGVSPAEIVFGHPTRDHLPRKTYKPRAAWAELATKREEAFVNRHFRKCEALNKNAVDLKPLILGQEVYIQNQYGPNPTKWGKSGTIIEVLPFSSYLVKIHGSNKVTKRNRKFLRAFTPFVQKVPDHVQEADTEPNQLSETAIAAMCMVYDQPLARATQISDSQVVSIVKLPDSYSQDDIGRNLGGEMRRIP